MATKRTTSMELSALREQLSESPPPPPANTSVREWFAGLALMNSVLMKDVPPGERAAEAVRIADDLLRALATARLPSEGSMGPPSAQELTTWERDIATKQERAQRQDRPTVPGFKRTMVPGAASPGRYSGPGSDEDE